MANQLKELLLIEGEDSPIDTKATVIMSKPPKPKLTSEQRSAQTQGQGQGTLSRKLLIGAFLTALIPLIITVAILGIVAERNSEAAIIAGIENQLITIRDNKKAQVEQSFEVFARQVVNEAHNPYVLSSIRDFTPSFARAILEANLSTSEIQQQKTAVSDYYNTTYAEQYSNKNGGLSVDTESLLSPLNTTTLFLQYNYLVDNPHPLGAKERLVEVADSVTSYDKAHAEHHFFFKDFAEAFGYYDIFLVEPQNGYIVYSVEKEIDFATSLIDGPYANTPIGEVFRQVVENPVQQAYFIDADFYKPSYDSNEMFVAAPIFSSVKSSLAQQSQISETNEDLQANSGESLPESQEQESAGSTQATSTTQAEGEFLGVLIFQIPSKRIDEIMTNNNQWRNVGLAQTGEAYLVAPSKLTQFETPYTLRSNSRFFVEDKSNYLTTLTSAGINTDWQQAMVAQGTVSGRQPIDTPGVREALEGNVGNGAFVNYLGVNVYSAFTPVEILGLNWGLLAEMNEKEILSPITDLRSALLGLSLVVLAIAAIIIIITALQFVRSITKPVIDIIEVVEKVGQGNLSETVQVSSNDEIGILANSFNNTIVRLRDSVQTEQERDQERLRREDLQNNIGNFLDVMMDVANGDLTKRGQVSEDVLGNVVDATNVMLEEMSYLLKEVQSTARGVSQSASDMINTTGVIAKDNQARVTKANQLSQAVQTVSDSINQMAQNATKSAQTAESTLLASQQGGQAVTDTLTGMQSIRQEVQGISKRIKNLGDRSLEISEITDTISDLSRQTNLLALNAAIEAAGAGEAGERFAVVANEVRKLASDSAESSQRVSQLIKNIQEEVQDVIASVEEGIREVESGYQVANEAGENLKEIGESAQSSAQVAKVIAETIQNQVKRIEIINTNLKEMALSGTQSLQIVNQGRQSAERLQDSSKVLITNLERFQLEA